MSRKTIIIISIFSVLAFILIIAASSGQREIDWDKTFNVNHKSPFGLYVFDKESNGLFKNYDIIKFSSSPYEFFDAYYNYDENKYDISGTVLKIGGENTIDPESAKELLYFAEHGNTVMLSMEHFPHVILDTLGLDIRYEVAKDSVVLNVLDKKNEPFWFKEGMQPRYFEDLEKSNDSITILGYELFDTIKRADFIQARYGKGRILLHTQPIAFTNFYLLKDSHYNYAEQVASKIPAGQLYWQSTDSSMITDTSSLRYIMAQPALKAVWRLGLCGLLIFIFFNAKRKQRVVPVITPLYNTTISFAKTIGNLYYQERDHHTIIDKKIIYFLEHIRTEYFIDTFSLDDDFVEKLHLKTGKPKGDIQKAVNLIKKHRHALSSTEADVVEINNAIEKLRL